MRMFVVTVVMAVCCVLSAQVGSAAVVTLDFAGLSNGESIDGVDFGPVTITSSGGSHLGAAIFDSRDTDNGGVNNGSSPSGGDPDLLVDQGNLVILQNNASPFDTQTTTGIFDTPNDDAGGGSIIFSFDNLAGVTLVSLLLADINGSAQTDVILTDTGGKTRTYDVPSKWTLEGVDNDSPDQGWAVLDLTTLLDQAGEAGATGGDASALEETGFVESGVVKLEVKFSGSGALGTLIFNDPSITTKGEIPEPSTLLALAGMISCFGGAHAFRRRRKQNVSG